MPANIDTIQHTYEFLGGWYCRYQASSTADAIAYANGRRAYLYHSEINGAIYLFVPVTEQP